MKINKADNVILNSIASCNTDEIKYDNVMIKAVGGNKYVGDDYKSVVSFLNLKG